MLRSLSLMRQVPSPGLSPHPGTQFHPAHPVTGWQGLLSGKVWLPVVSYTFSNFIYGKPAHSTASSMFSVSVRTVSCTGLNHLTPHEEQLTQNGVILYVDFWEWPSPMATKTTRKTLLCLKWIQPRMTRPCSLHVAHQDFSVLFWNNNF